MDIIQDGVVIIDRLNYFLEEIGKPLKYFLEEIGIDVNDYQYIKNELISTGYRCI